MNKTYSVLARTCTCLIICLSLIGGPTFAYARTIETIEFTASGLEDLKTKISPRAEDAKKILILPAIPVLVSWMIKGAVSTIPDYILGTVLYFLTGIPYSGWSVFTDFLTNLIPAGGELRRCCQFSCVNSSGLLNQGRDF